jgi:hypothetical protein
MKGIKNIIFKFNKEASTEKAFMQSIIISVFGFVLCIVSLCSATWAWFSTDISSSENNIQAAHYNVTVTVKSGDAVITDNNGKYRFEEDKDYIVTLEAYASAQSVYCVFVTDNGEYCTSQISTSTSENTMTIMLRFSETKEIEIIPSWGYTSAGETTGFFTDGGCYLDLQRVESLPPISSETNLTTEATPVDSISEAIE